MLVMFRMRAGYCGATDAAVGFLFVFFGFYPEFMLRWEVP